MVLPPSTVVRVERRSRLSAIDIGMNAASAQISATNIVRILYLFPHLRQAAPMREVWRACSPPSTLLFSPRRGLRPRRVEKMDFWGDLVSPNPSLRKSYYSRLSRPHGAHGNNRFRAP